MKIAVTYSEGEVFQHFGHCGQFKIYETDGNSIISSHVEDAAGSGHGALAQFLLDLGVDALICGGIGGGARSALAVAGITLYPGVSGKADECVEDFLSGKLIYNPDVICSHHHAEGHTCGGHSCGEDKHGCKGN